MQRPPNKNRQNHPVLVPVYVARSKIHGAGLFAKDRIAAGAVISIGCGTPTSDDGPYVLWLDDERGVRLEPPLKYVNHSAAPNACFYDDLSLVALREIQPHEEITHDYGASD